MAEKSSAQIRAEQVAALREEVNAAELAMNAAWTYWQNYLAAPSQAPTSLGDRDATLHGLETAYSNAAGRFHQLQRKLTDLQSN